MEIGCCGCFGFSIRSRRGIRPRRSDGFISYLSQDHLLDGDMDDEDDGGMSSRSKHSEEVLMFKIRNGLICRQVLVEDTCKLTRSEDQEGNKMINEYARERKIGEGSYANVILYRNSKDEKHYAIKDDNDELRRSPGTPIITAPECYLGVTYHGKAADTWAVGVTFYCMVTGIFPFIGESLQDTYDKIVNNPLCLPDDINPQLSNVLE